MAMLPPELNCTSEVEEALRMTVSGFSILWSRVAEKVKHRWFSPLGEVGVVPAGNTRAWFTAAKSVPTIEWEGREMEDREKGGRGGGREVDRKGGQGKGEQGGREGVKRKMG